ncbi:hypothetical protein LOAG_03165 [Loa loa]|uniref:Uncharacterized protein n=1 Tax=Loa loa TaxID=7209 RepID=A0A1S0U538_LOALO|nr:hypothetical protein LOAG_03165 [Loa loa]EFO25318.1 hypothetical protein LOAG_03165 [Loa loa]
MVRIDENIISGAKGASTVTPRLRSGAGREGCVVVEYVMSFLEGDCSCNP